MRWVVGINSMDGCHHERTRAAHPSQHHQEEQWLTQNPHTAQVENKTTLQATELMWLVVIAAKSD